MTSVEFEAFAQARATAGPVVRAGRFIADRGPRAPAERCGLDGVLPPGGALAGRLFSRLLGDTHDDPPLAPGTRIGYWRIGGLLGCGGSATVYLADRDDGNFEQQVALKVVRPNRALIEQFRRERQILAELRHPAIARLIDGGEIAGGRLWLAMEPVFGERIDHYVRNRRLPLDQRLALFEAACEAVAYAHRRRLVHRDIKPGNLLVDEAGRPRLLDFGIATTDDDHDEGDRAMTPIYASPEQHAGGVVTAASDIYQLGVLLRVLLMPEGHPCATLPHRPRTIVMRELTAVAARATETDPSRRYRSVASLGSDVAAVRQRRAVSVIDGSCYPVARFFERHATVTVIAIVAVAALLSTGWMALRMSAADAYPGALSHTAGNLVAVRSASDAPGVLASKHSADAMSVRVEPPPAVPSDHATPRHMLRRRR